MELNDLGGGVILYINIQVDNDSLTPQRVTIVK